MSFEQAQEEMVPRDGELALVWTGQAGFSFKSPKGFVLHVDPFLSDVCSRYIGYHRAIDPPVTMEHIRGNVFLFTHEHRDHLDTDSIPAIVAGNPQATFVGPPACVDRLLEIGVPLDRIVPIIRGGNLCLGDVGVRAVTAIHTDDSVGYVLNISGVEVYISGDTVYTDQLAGDASLRPELMMVCINGRMGCMDIQDAARLTEQLQPTIAIPMHVDMFVENTADAGEFVQLVHAGNGATKAVKMAHGKWYLYSKEKGLRLEGAGAV